jgi:peptidoglycan hydrolase-like protein with peptidoglycan-binding domain
MKSPLLSASLAFVFIAAVISPSLVQASSPSGDVAPKCYQLSSNLRAGASGSDVTTFQEFLVTQGLFDASNLGTAHFGPITLRAAIRFQAAHGVPQTGFVGSLTRAAMASVQNNCTVSTATPAVLYALNPASGGVGTEVRITGFGFTTANTITMDGSVVARDVPITSSVAISCTTSPTCHGGINQTIVFTVPSSLSPNCAAGMMCPMYQRLVTNGDYAVTVQNANGTSKPLTFSVTGVQATQ